jgi:hypothetical protein
MVFVSLSDFCPVEFVSSQLSYTVKSTSGITTVSIGWVDSNWSSNLYLHFICAFSFSIRPIVYVLTA